VLRHGHVGPVTEVLLHGTETLMNTAKLVGILLIAAGAIGLIYGSFSYTKDTSAVKLGPLELTVKEKETVNVPVWAGIGAIVVGAALLVMGGKKG
jgi:multidrug transporter EmrE-like cation transporter